MIDDATSRSWGRFVWRDGTRENMGVLWEYLVRFGRAVDYYTDRDTMFAVPPRPGESRAQQRQADRLTQIGRALRELGIGWIAAYSPQAKAYASHCTSFAHCATTRLAGTLFENLTPWAFRGGFSPGCSYKQSFLPL